MKEIVRRRLKEEESRRNDNYKWYIEKGAGTIYPSKRAKMVSRAADEQIRLAAVKDFARDILKDLDHYAG
jgi:hypothetical protein